MPKVSVIIPVYGVEKYIERCTRSLFEQTIDDIEYIFVDDCSIDNSMCILKTVLADYPNRLNQTKIYRMSENSGLAAVRKFGLQFATGEYIIHCDSDDWVDLNMYNVMYDVAKRNDADMVVCDFEFSNGHCMQGNGLKCDLPDRLAFMNSMLYRKTSWSLWNKLVRASIYANVKHFPLYYMGEDMVVSLQLVYYCKTISYIPRSLYHYYVNPVSMSRKKGLAESISRFKQGIANMSIVDRFIESTPDYKFLKSGLNFARFNKKRFLDLSYSECRYLWRKTYPFVELKVALDRNVNLATKKKALKCFIQAYISNNNKKYRGVCK